MSEIIGHTLDGKPYFSDDPNITVLPAYHDRKRNAYVIWCDHCKTWHWHSPEDGHRAPHCHVKNSPYQHGYILRYVGEFTPAVKRMHRTYGRK